MGNTTPFQLRSAVFHAAAQNEDEDHGGRVKRFLKDFSCSVPFILSGGEDPDNPEIGVLEDPETGDEMLALFTDKNALEHFRHDGRGIPKQVPFRYVAKVIKESETMKGIIINPGMTHSLSIRREFFDRYVRTATPDDEPANQTLTLIVPADAPDEIYETLSGMLSELDFTGEAYLFWSMRETRGAYLLLLRTWLDTQSIIRSIREDYGFEELDLYAGHKVDFLYDMEAIPFYRA